MYVLDHLIRDNTHCYRLGTRTEWCVCLTEFTHQKVSQSSLGASATYPYGYTLSKSKMRMYHVSITLQDELDLLCFVDNKYWDDNPLAPLGALPRCCGHSAGNGFQNMIAKRENTGNQTMGEDTKAKSQWRLQKKDWPEMALRFQSHR